MNAACRVASYTLLTALSCAGLGCGDDAESSPETIDGGVAVGVRVLSAAARSCELVIEDDARGFRGVVPAEQVEVRAIAQGPRVGVAFYVARDGRFPDPALDVSVSSDQAASGLSLGAVHCFDRDGSEIDEPQAELRL